MRAMILAAGRGERLRPLTDTIPKSLVEIHGEPLLERHLKNVAAAGITDVVINLGWLGDKLRERIGDGDQFDLKVAYSDEGDNVLETGGGIHKALPLLGDEPFLVVNADVYTDMPIPEIELAESIDAHLVLVPTPAYRDKGDFGLEDGLVTNDAIHTFSGVSMYRPSFFDECEAGRFSVVPLLRDAADAGRLAGSLYEGIWADVGTPERLAEIEDFDE
ncbi:MAG: N-acetylmuramate alpha-1-phosphate uridylyltransferase MurU [Pseudomonadota bacterium]